MSSSISAYNPMAKFDEITIAESSLVEKRRYYRLNPSAFTDRVREELWKATEELDAIKYKTKIKSFWDISTLEQQLMLENGTVDSYTIRQYNQLWSDAAAFADAVCGNDQEASEQAVAATENQASVEKERPAEQREWWEALPEEETQNEEGATVALQLAEEDDELKGIDPDASAEQFGLYMQKCELIDCAEKAARDAVNEAVAEIKRDAAYVLEKVNEAAEIVARRMGIPFVPLKAATSISQKSTEAPVAPTTAASTSSQKSSQAKAQTVEHDEFDV